MIVVKILLYIASIALTLYATISFVIEVALWSRSYAPVSTKHRLWTVAKLFIEESISVGLFALARYL